jgi:hypothetical protein
MRKLMKNSLQLITLRMLEIRIIIINKFNTSKNHSIIQCKFLNNSNMPYNTLESNKNNLTGMPQLRMFKFNNRCLNNKKLRGALKKVEENGYKND